ncbi:MAG: LamB/YcsF family protein, partial [Flavobacteriaceae bacterium]
SETVLEVLVFFDTKIEIYLPFNSVLLHMAKEIYPVKFEVFIDRRYGDDGTLVHRNHKEALILDPDKAWKQLFQMYSRNTVTSIHGNEIVIEADTFCIHGDNKNAVYILEHIHSEMSKNNISLQ